jgi:hypothetical protein
VAGSSRLRGRERRSAARAAIEIGDTTEETVNVNETTPEPVKENYPAKNAENTEKLFNAVEISLFTGDKGTDEAMNLENSVSGTDKCTVEKVAVIFKGEAGKDVKTDTYTQMKQYPIQDLRWI